MVIRKGEIDQAALRREHMSRDDLDEDLRASGIDDPAKVQGARLERSGKLSGFCHLHKSDLYRPYRYLFVDCRLPKPNSCRAISCVTFSKNFTIRTRRERRAVFSRSRNS